MVLEPLSRSTARRSTSPPACTAREALRPDAAGLRVAVDPETGTLGMPEHATTSPGVDELQADARRIARELVTVRHADGSESIAHAGRLTDYTMVQVGPDGKLVFQCAQGATGIPERMPPVRPARPALEEE
jgi:hypothetical protein